MTTEKKSDRWPPNEGHRKHHQLWDSTGGHGGASGHQNGDSGSPEAWTTEGAKQHQKRVGEERVEAAVVRHL